MTTHHQNAGSSHKRPAAPVPVPPPLPVGSSSSVTFNNRTLPHQFHQQRAGAHEAARAQYCQSPSSAGTSSATQAFQPPTMAGTTTSTSTTAGLY